MKKAPGKSYREGMTLIQLFQKFPDDAAAERWFEQQRWGEAGKPDHCPMCGSTEKMRPVPSGRPLPYWCGSCRRNFSFKTGTVMHRSHIGLQKWAIASYLWGESLKGVSSMRLHRDLGITQKSAHFMAQRLREAWSQPTAEMSGPVEVDESYSGGKRRNKSNAKRRKLADTGLGPVDSTAVAGIKDRETNTVTARVFESMDKPTLLGFIGENVEPGSQVYTDEAAAYRNMDDYVHEAVNHSVSEYVNGMAHTNGVESFWALLKRGYHGTFHHISEKHLHRYVNEFATRHNLRPRDIEAIMAETVARMTGKRLTYVQLVANLKEII